MLRDLALKHHGRLADRLPEHWRRPLAHLAIAWLVLVLLFARVFADMAHQFWDSSTYNHILFVPLIIGWLAAIRAPELARLTPEAWWPGLLGLAGALFLWLLGDISGTALAMHLAMVLALQSIALAMLGPRVAIALAFPMAYALFLVPFGDEMVPFLQMVTAKLAIALTHWSGVPAEIEGVFIDTPAGLFEVAEACSGVKFLVAMVALGTLAAHLCFRSWTRRALFMLAAIVLPVLANGVRAWGTIYIAQSAGIEFAAGFDHVFYGWVFFALVMALLMALSWRFFDRPRDDRFIDGERIAAMSLPLGIDALRTTFGRILVAVALLGGAFGTWAAFAREVRAPLPQAIDLPEVAGWSRDEFAEGVWWEPRAGGADHRLIGSYVAPDGARVEVFYALYSAQEEGREAGAFGEGALMPESAWRWHSPGPDMGQGLSEHLQAGGDVHRLALTFYRHGDLLTGSVLRLKLSNMADRLFLHPQPTAMLIVSSVDGGPVPAEQSIARFVQSTGPVGEWMDRTGQNP